MNVLNKNLRGKTALLMVAICLSFFCPMVSKAELNADLRDPYLEREYDWAMYLDTHDLKQYLTYPGSQLHPITVVRINFRALNRGARTRPKSAAIFEDFWYHNGTPVGLRRYNQLNIAPDLFGVIVIGADDDQPEHGTAVANALVRLLLDLQLKQIITSVVMVPSRKYDQLAGELGRYGFFPYMRVMAGQQMSIHLRTYPRGKDQYYFFQKGY